MDLHYLEANTRGPEFIKGLKSASLFYVDHLSGTSEA